MLIALCLWLALAVPQSDVRPKDDRPVVVVRGCLEGSTLKVTSADTDRVKIDVYRLRIPKSLTAALKEHRGHEEELTGSLIEPRSRMGGSKTKKIGSRTKVYVGASEENTAQQASGADVPQLEVKSVTHIAPVCKR